MLTLDRAAFTGEVYNVGGPEALTIRALAERLCRILNINPTFSFSGSNRVGDAECWLADMSKLEALGYAPGLSVDDGLRATINWVADDLKLTPPC